MNKLKKLLVLPAIWLFASFAQAWPVAVDWTTDNVGVVNDINRCDSTEPFETIQGYANYPSECHRWNLIWTMGGYLSNTDNSDVVTVTLDRIIDWNPAVTGDDRLPTIKELVRLFTYDGSAGIQDAVLRKWLILGCNDQEAVDDGKLCNSVEIELRDKSDDGQPSIFANKEAYLISSTYRDYDGDLDNDRVQILGVRISDGKIVAFEPGPKGGWFRYYANNDGMLALCEGFEKAANGEVNGDCEYQTSSEGSPGSIEYTFSADRSVVPIFSLLVRETPVVE